eukprot:473271-Alexandrium_andersonii.AAC.1
MGPIGLLLHSFATVGVQIYEQWVTVDSHGASHSLVHMPFQQLRPWAFKVCRDAEVRVVLRDRFGPQAQSFDQALAREGLESFSSDRL